MSDWRWVMPAVALSCTLDLTSFYAARPDSSSACTFNSDDSQAQFFDQPGFTVAGVTDNTYRGGHGSDTVLRSAESLAKAASSLSGADDRSEDPLEAVQAFQRAAELNPSEGNLFDWGAELLRHRATAAAAEVLSRGVRLYPQSLRMQLGLASAWYVGGSYQKAAECFFRAADLHPTDAQPYSFLSKVQAREITESDGYLGRMARFAKLQPQNPSAKYFYAMALWRRKLDLPLARSLLESSVSLDRAFAPAYLQLGIMNAGEGKYSEAIEQYAKAIDLSPDLEEAHYRLSEAYRITGDRASAAQELALYRRLSKQSSEQVERERRELRQFVVDLRSR